MCLQVLRKLILFCLLATVFFTVSGQSVSSVVRLSGKILSLTGDPIEGCSIKLSRKNSESFLLYSYTGSSNVFNLQWNYARADTFFIDVDRLGFEKKRHSIFIDRPGNYEITISLQQLVKTLEEVSIIANNTWQAGDSTFFKVDAFKEGGEMKLIDIIKKLPGFRIDKDGDLIFKNSKVEKITINNQELFADKVNLLLNNFPVHIIETIQALENQNAVKLLKGIAGDNSTFINISLKDKHKNIFFGELEAGIGTQERYAFNPLLFLLNEKIKVGTINRINNIGNSTDEFEYQQLKGIPNIEAENSMLTASKGVYIPDFSRSRYNFNKNAESRIQFNIPININNTSETELTFLRDRFNNSLLQNSTVYSNGTFFSRESVINSSWKPSFGSIREKVSFQTGKKSEMQILLFLTKDKTSAASSNVISQNGEIYSSENSIRNDFFSGNAEVNFVKKYTKQNAIQLKINMGYLNYSQNGSSTSNSWPQSFNLADSSYQYLSQNLYNKSFYVKSLAEYFFKIKRRKLSIRLNSEYTTANLSAPLKFISNDNNKQPIDYLFLSQSGKYNILKVYSSFSYGLRILDMPVTINITNGFADIFLQENTRNKKLLYTYGFFISFKKVHNKYISSNGSIALEQTSRNIYSLPQNIYPKALASFVSVRNSTLPQKEIRMNYSTYFRLKNYSSFSLSQLIATSANNSLYIPVNNALYSFGIDSLISRSTFNYSTVLGYVFPVVPIKTKFTIRLIAGFGENLIYLENQIVKSRFTNNQIEVGAKKTIRKKVIIDINTKLEIFNNKLPQKFNNSLNEQSFNFISSGSIKYKFFKTMEANLLVEAIQNKVQKSSNSSLLADISLSRYLKNDKIRINAKLENIANAKNYLQQNRYSIFEQNYSRIPLIRRNIFISISFNF